ncbi:MAG: VOC family protein [Saprospiraceae bacterium]|nr:VOC family protein [Saprospiraceae bacterium]
MNLNQVTLPTKNMEQAIAFYQLLGLKLIVDSRPRYARFECPEGDSTFSLHQVDQWQTDPGTSIYFECGNLDEKVEELQKEGVIFDAPITDQSWLWREARLRDPDGNHLILYLAGTNRKNPPWRIGGS